MRQICVVGSLNVDLTIRLERFHMPGETVNARDIKTYPGGKGGNQAVALAKLGKSVMMIGMLGADENGRFYRRVLEQHGIDIKGVGESSLFSSGTAVIEVDDRGENRIAIVPGTNQLVNNAYVDGMLERMLPCDIFLMQFEIAIETVCHLAKILRAAGKTVILDPAPVAKAPDELYENVDFLTPNATELAALSGHATDTLESAVLAARTILKRGAKAVIAKLGERGCLYVDGQTAYPCAGFRVNCVDTTAAGDSFNAGFAAALADGMPVDKALRFANAVGALSTTGMGAQSSMPTFEQVEVFLANNP
ncbi:MAG: ribokinase [Clostridia bacterium]|nr:ribokinase [Clostridia bacterium]